MCSISKTPFFCKQKISAHEGTEKVAICHFLHGRSTELINFRESRRIDNGEEKFNARLRGTNYTKRNCEMILASLLYR